MPGIVSGRSRYCDGFGKSRMIAAAFTGFAVAGIKRSPWLVVAALAGHGVMDFFHHDLVHNAGVPSVWPGFCAAFDITAAAYLAWVLVARGNAGITGGLRPIGITER